MEHQTESTENKISSRLSLTMLDNKYLNLYIVKGTFYIRHELSLAME